MNYIKEINAFYDWLETNSLSTSGIVLWHALMSINNKAGWTAEFAAATSVLCVKTGLSPRTISKARNELKQKGRIDWRSRKGNQSAVYKIIPFLSAPDAHNHAGNNANNYANNNLSAYNADSHADNRADSHADNRADNHATLNKHKLNKTKQNNNNNNHDNNAREKLSVFEVFEREFGRPLSPMEYQQILAWAEKHDQEIIKEALRRAVLNGKYNLRYIDKILLTWEKANRRTLRDVLEYERAFEQSKHGRQPSQDDAKKVEIQAKRKDEKIKAACEYIKLQLGNSPPKNKAVEIAKTYGEELVPVIIDRLYGGGEP